MTFLFLALFLALCFAHSAAAIDVFVRNPRDGEIVFGPVEIRVEVLSAEPIEAVTVHLDGELVARMTKPPYHVTIDTGDENRAKTIEVTAHDVFGETATRTVTTGVVVLDEQVDIELQQLYVTATRDGSRVLDLGRDAFEVFDDGARQEIVTFEGGDVPLTAVLLVDSSLSMAGEQLRAALAGASAFVEGMRELDEAQVFVFSDRTLASTPRTGDPAVVASVITAVAKTIGAGGGTAVNDHLYLALKELDQRQGRRVVILLSDGVDVDSVLGMKDVLWKAGRTQALIYWIRTNLRGAADMNALRYHSAWRDPAGHRRELEALERTVTESGGRVQVIDRIEKAAGAFRDILAELREQYVLGYYPSVNVDDGKWHEVRLRVSEPGVRLRTRGGYFDDL